MEKLRQHLINLFGTNIDLRAQPQVLQEILDEINTELATPGSRAAGYHKTYFKDYDKIGYDRTYQQYDKTTDGAAMLEELSLGAEVVKNFDPDLIERYEQIKAVFAAQKRPIAVASSEKQDSGKNP